jgi:hypothetical protein
MKRSLVLAALLVAAMLVAGHAAANTAATGKYTTHEALPAAFTANLTAVAKSGWTLRTSDLNQKSIEAIRNFDSNEFAALIILLSQQPDHVLIEATFTRYDGFIGCCKPADYATKYGKQLRSLLPDLTVEVTKDAKPQRVARAAMASVVENEAAKTEPGLTNDDVVKLAAAGLDDEVVVAKVKSAARVQFDLSTDALLALKAMNVSKFVVAAMIEHDAAQQASPSPKTSPSPSQAQAPQSPCAGVELLGIYKEDMRPVSPLIIWLTKIRNGTSVTRQVTLQWLNMYAEELQSSVEVAAGQIATLQLAAQEPFQRQPINLKLSSCR